MPDRTCVLPGCERQIYAHSTGYCRKHQWRFVHDGDPLAEPRCTLDGCDRPFCAQGYCKLHYTRFKATGDPGPVAPLSEVDVRDRFMAHVDVLDDGCWRWRNRDGVDGTGYGVFWSGGIARRAHRASYELYVGPIPDDLQLDHFRYPQDGCMGAGCVNPQHVRPATHRENTLRANTPSSLNRAKEACLRGHEFTPDNTYLRPEGRRCRTCRSDQRRERRARQRLTTA